jgi:integrase
LATLLEPQPCLVRGKPRWLLDLRSFGGGRRYFKKQSEAEDLYLRKLDEIKDYGRAAEALSHRDRIEFLSVRDQLAEVGATIQDARDFFLAHGTAFIARKLDDAIWDIEEAKEKANTRPAYSSLLGRTLRSFRASMPVEHCHEVTRQMIEDWLHKNDWQPATRKSCLSTLRTFFNFCKGRNWVKLNPTANIERILLDDKAPGILTVEQVKTVLARCLKLDPQLSAFLAVQFFGGLRPCEATRLRPEDIQRGFIDVKGKKAKTRKRRLVTINPTLKAWLRLGVHLPIKNQARRMKRIRYEVEEVLKYGKKKWRPVVPWTQDCIRHSFCSYHLAQFKDAAATALEAGHTEQMLFGHYRELVDPKEARAFWAIRPGKI